MKKVRLAVLVSGGGTTLQNLLDRIADGRLHADVAVVVSNSEKAYGLERARKAHIATAIVPHAGLTHEDFSQRIFDACRDHMVDLVILGGFLRLLRIPDDFKNRVMNIHPSLIPAFCGHGFHGEKVHQSAIDRGVKLSGCTVHFADNEYDHGPIIVQQSVPVLDDDTAATLSARVFAAECEAFPEAINLFAAGRLHIVDRRVAIRPPLD